MSVGIPPSDNVARFGLTVEIAILTYLFEQTELVPPALSDSRADSKLPGKLENGTFIALCAAFTRMNRVHFHALLNMTLTVERVVSVCDIYSRISKVRLSFSMCV